MKKLTVKILMAAMMMAGLLNLTVSAANVLVWPVPASHNLSQGLHDNNAIDISAAAGSAVVAAKGGTVTKITYCTQTHYNYGDCNGFGTGLVILGDDGRAYQYAHMQGGSIPSNVSYGARVETGQQIGKVGSTGYAYGPHLHFGISNTRNYWEAGPNPANETYGTAAAQVSVGNQSASNISNTNAKLFGTLYKTAGNTCSVCGIYLGTSSSSMTKRNSEAVGSASNNYRNGTGFDIWYDLTGELGIVLTPGTTYYYKIYAVVNGKEYTGPVSSFKTTGSAPGSVISLRTDTSGNSSDYGVTGSSYAGSGNSSAATPSASAGSAAKPAASLAASSGTGAAAAGTPSTSASSAAKTSTPSASAGGSGTAKAAPQGSADSSAAKKTAKKEQKLKVSPGKTVLKYKNIKNRKMTFKLKITGQKGKLTIKSGSRFIRIKGNKVTIAKKTPKGTYKIKVKAAGTSAYKAASRTIKIVIK